MRTKLASKKQVHDVLTKEQRKYCMSRIRGRNTKPEIKIRNTLWRMGFRYRLNSNLPGHPDFVFIRQKIAVFVDGCFWHGCPTHGTIPKTNRDFWKNKIEKTVLRDAANASRLNELGWQVVRVWEHDVESDVVSTAKSIARIINIYYE